MGSDHSEPTPPSFSLREIASWTPGVFREVKTKIRASIPALQRGLVWTPQQNELLWDSILRGFPIGAVVVTRWSDKLKKTAEAADESITYHLLDGQQRCHAIALGFSDPFVAKETSDNDKVESILWLDLNPTPERNSTRNFWVRATTTAHPWGYRKDDAATPLTAWAIREALKPLGLDAAKPEYRRPSPMDLWPCDAAAKIPVPLSWLLQLPVEDESTFWTKLGTRAKEATRFPWAARIRDFCVTDDAAENKPRIFKAIKRAHAAKLIALETPDELLEGSEQEKSGGSDREDVSNIEQLFQRLNRQGTKLDGEELAYSMIKAHWPDLEKPINDVSEGRMPQARMVSLGVRAALATEAKHNLPGPPTVSALRVIARSEKDKKAIIQSFITQDLGNACEMVGQWLKYDAQTNPSGLLPVHITSIAMSSREVYLLLLHFANRLLEGHAAPAGWTKAMQAMATMIHWFAPEKAKVANRVYVRCRDGMSLDNIRTALLEAHTAGEIQTIHAPKAVEDFIRLPESGLKDWNWWQPIHGDGTAEGIQQRRRVWEVFLNFRNNRGLLLYAQRGYLARRFRDYDPARKDLWEAHNRPWDFDHILASYYFHNRKDGSDFRGICGQWGYTIGNLRAWPFEDNRSDQAEEAAKKIKGDPSRLEDSFLTTDEELAFSGGDKARRDEAAARSFVVNCRRRLLRIYRTWYEAVGVENLVTTHEENNSIATEPAAMIASAV
ncbi:MAG: DUF262 domain-containing protein [Prosthecobacter sp.]|uniref:DUF262 domain-containing protein n=1 Tax=Prosthecobacter sp. TaxID=1965333 RepID=UPI0025F88041|nr:DUF262 domain-containing protein [Prosthecobacter sp.]MCF7788323.1 DUF262 domain-containing protein [Prosthecobacter sp.]